MHRGLRPWHLATASCAMAILLAGCGQKGALYLPDQSRNAVVVPAESSVPMASPVPAATPAAPAAAPAPSADPAATAPAATAPADPAKPDSQRRSNNPPRPN